MIAQAVSDAAEWVDMAKSLTVVAGSIAGVVVLAKVILTGQSGIAERQTVLLDNYRLEVHEMRGELDRLESRVDQLRAAVTDCRSRETQLITAIEALGGEVPPPLRA